MAIAQKPVNPQMTVVEAADFIRVSPKTIRRMVAEGRLRAYKLGPRTMRIDPADLQKMLAQVAPSTYAHVSGGNE